ncbi:multidrug resistance-associated 9 isoform X1, partial [Paramuricea clavata]
MDDTNKSEFVEKSSEETKAPQNVSCSPYVWLDNVSSKLPTSSLSNLEKNSVSLLKDISLKILSKGFVIVTGSVGSGKSSLLASILNNELRITKGKVKHLGNIAYVSDKPWVFPGTIRENILFGSAYDEKWYLETIKACQLEKDFRRFPVHDLSRIGEHGATLSGGQRTRLALARAVYSRADIYLMDDPLSSLDAKVAENIFRNVLKRMLSERIVFLVTHKHFNDADYIIMLDKGVVSRKSLFIFTTIALTSARIEPMISELILTEKKFWPSQGNVQGNKIYKEMQFPSKFAPENVGNLILGYTSRVLPAHIVDENIDKDHVEDGDDPVQQEQLHEVEEDRQVGNVSIKVDAKYFTHGAPASILFLILLGIGAGQGLTMWIDIQVASLPTLAKHADEIRTVVIVYLISLIASALLNILANCCIFLLPIRANYKLHKKMVSCLLQATTYFYAVNPPGRILNRFSQDINNLDDLLPFNLAYFIQCVKLSVGAIILCLVANVLLLPVIVITIIICFGLSRLFFNSAMDIKRLMSQGGGPLYSHFSNTMEGLRIIRVHNRQQQFTNVLFRNEDLAVLNCRLPDGTARFIYKQMGRKRPNYKDPTARTSSSVNNINYTLYIYIKIALEISYSNRTKICINLTDRHHEAMYAYYAAAHSSTAVLASVAILYSFNSAIYIAAAVRNAVEVQAQMTSAERILAYTEIKSEKGHEINEQPPKEWPEFGRIEFKNVSLQYYENGFKALKDISFQINPSEKIGVAGRTGAGKSSLVAALMRIGETEGDIIVDNANIAYLNLQSTRQRISVISQSPELFNGSIRENLNPTGEFNDSEIWNILDLIKLSFLVRSLPGKLDHLCTGGGTNFSVGQRQLFHLARVLLKQNKIIIFDEATGKVDRKTAEQIQNVIHDVLKDCTVIIISHRMTTIQKCEKIMVLDQGCIVEFDKQHVLSVTSSSVLALVSMSTRQRIELVYENNA